MPCSQKLPDIFFIFLQKQGLQNVSASPKGRGICSLACTLKIEESVYQLLPPIQQWFSCDDIEKSGSGSKGGYCDRGESRRR
jgi:hypothetical protein